MKIAIRYTNGKQFRQVSSFLPFLKIIEKYPFPKPVDCSYTNPKLKWLHCKISSFTDDQLLKRLEPVRRNPITHIVALDDLSGAHLHFAVTQKSDTMLILSNLLPFIKVDQVKQLFMNMVSEGHLLDNGWCGASVTSILEKHFPSENGYTITMLTWLQYYGKEELEKRGGFAAFESNPYVQTQRIHDGLIVQVGESPDAFDTPEGEQLLVNAINALPPLKV
jgi:hypothetical protein